MTMPQQRVDSWESAMQQDEDNLDHIHTPQDPNEFTLADMSKAEAKRFARKALEILERRRSSEPID